MISIAHFTMISTSQTYVSTMQTSHIIQVLHALTPLQSVVAQHLLSDI